MSAFSDAIQDFFAAQAGFHADDFADRVNAAFRAAQDATADEATWAAGPLVELVARSAEPRLSVVGLLGELLCRGVNFWGVIPHYLAGLKFHLARGAEVYQAIRPLWPAGKRLLDLDAEEGRTIYDHLPERLRNHAQTLVLISYLLGPAMPLFGDVKPFRQLARAPRLETDWLRDPLLGHDWLAQVPALLDANADADGPLPDTTALIDATLVNLRQASVRQPRGKGDLQQAVRPLFEATLFVQPEVQDRVAAELARIAADADATWAGQLAGMCGSFVERGANPEPGADALLAGLSRLLDPTVAFVKACRASPTNEDESPVDVHADAVARDMPEARRALEAVSHYCLGTVAHLARSPAARKRHNHDAVLLDKLDAVRWDTGNTGFLWKMLQVLDDEELVVLAPRFSLGWRVTIGGVADNFQLHALVGGYLVGQVDDGKYPGVVSTHDQPEPGPGVPLSPRAIATQTNAPCTGREPGFSSNIQLWNWTALQSDGSLPDDPVAASHHWIWNEGVPADILPFEGTRIVLLDRSTIQRNWNGGRIFPFLPASFEVVETMSPETARSWLTRIAPSPGRPGSTGFEA